MTCPVCNGMTKVSETRNRTDHILRYRLCRDCGHRFPTIEIDEDMFKHPAKSDQKLRKLISYVREISTRLSDLGDRYD